jgi:hypothetical protein
MKGFIMTSLLSFPRLAVAGLLLVGAGAASAADWGDTSGLPACPETFTQTATPQACLLPVRNADFELGVMGDWLGSDWASSTHGLNLVGPDRDGEGYAALLRQAETGISQVVALPRNPGGAGGREATYITRFRVSSDGNAPVTLLYRARFIDADGQTIGNVTHGEVTTDGSDYVHVMRHPARDLPEHARLAIEVIRGDDASQGLAAYVDDVSVSVRDRK